MSYININGKITEINNASLPVDNGAFRYGYGLFETMLVRDGVVLLAGYHKERLYEGLKQIYLETPALLREGIFEEQVLKTVKKNKLDKLCRVRLQVYAGGGGLYGNDVVKTGFVIECYELNEEVTRLNENGLVTGIATAIAKNNDSLSHLKSCNALVYAIAARQAKANKWNDALICNTRGNIIESTIANIFWVKDDCIYTPPLSEGCIAGVMRKHIILLAGSIKEAPLTPERLWDADELFLTNAIRGIKWVGIAGDKKYGNKLIRSL